MYEIEVGIPVPDGVRTRAGKYPFRDMPVGGSIAVAGPERYKVYEAARKFRSRNAGWDFKMARVNPGWRLWRTS